MKSPQLCSLAICALFALSPPAFAQMQSGSDIGLPSTGTSADTAGAAGSAPRSLASPDISSGAASGVPLDGAPRGALPPGEVYGCEGLVDEERIRCLREAAAAGSAGPGSVGSGAAGGATVGPGGAAATPGVGTGVR